MIRQNCLLHALLLCGALAACMRGDGAAADSGAVTPPPDSSVAAIPPDDGTFTVNDSGAGPLRIGMTFAEAAVALGGAVPDTARLERACAHVPLDGVPRGALLMWVEGRIARIDVDSTSITTAQGARVGDSGERIRSLYAGRIVEKPHKYDERGRYLVVPSQSSGSDSLALVFETDGAQVTRYRVGRQPEVEWVEGCS